MISGMRDESEGIWKEAILNSVKESTQHLFGEKPLKCSDWKHLFPLGFQNILRVFLIKKSHFDPSILSL